MRVDGAVLNVSNTRNDWIPNPTGALASFRLTDSSLLLDDACYFEISSEDTEDTTPSSCVTCVRSSVTLAPTSGIRLLSDSRMAADRPSYTLTASGHSEFLSSGNGSAFDEPLESSVETGSLQVCTSDTFSQLFCVFQPGGIFCNFYIIGCKN